MRQYGNTLVNLTKVVYFVRTGNKIIFSFPNLETNYDQTDLSYDSVYGYGYSYIEFKNPVDTTTEMTTIKTILDNHYTK